MASMNRVAVDPEGRREHLSLGSLGEKQRGMDVVRFGQALGLVFGRPHDELAGGDVDHVVLRRCRIALWRRFRGTDCTRQQHAREQ